MNKHRKRSGYELVPFNWNSSAPKNYLQRGFPTLRRLYWWLEVAPGHTFWLADLEYKVHLIDPVYRLGAQAQRRSNEADRHIESCSVDDARELKWDDGS